MNSFDHRPGLFCHTASLSFCRVPYIYCRTKVWKQPAELTKLCRKWCPSLSLPGHWFSLAVWGVLEDQSLFSCKTCLRMLHHALHNAEGASGTAPDTFLCSSVSWWKPFWSKLSCYCYMVVNMCTNNPCLPSQCRNPFSVNKIWNLTFWIALVCVFTLQWIQLSWARACVVVVSPAVL